MTEIIIASTNDGKIREIISAMGTTDIRWFTYNDFPDWPQIEESAPTFEGNARKKAVSLATYFNKLALADDSGLEVDALDGRPGVSSARFAGSRADTDRNNAKLLEMLKDVPYEKRTARFRCVMALASPDNSIEIAEGLVQGHIVLKPSGDKGFGYDPLFIPTGHDRTMAELDLVEKNRISHRGQAIAKMKAVIEDLAR